MSQGGFGEDEASSPSFVSAALQNLYLPRHPRLLKFNGSKANSISSQPAFHSSGTIGSQFTSQGALGGTAQKVGGPFDKEGSIGKQFTEQGAIGGSVQQTLGKGEENTVNK